MYKASYYFKWAGLEAFKQDMEGIFNTEQNSFKCNIAMSYVIYNLSMKKMKKEIIQNHDQDIK